MAQIERTVTLVLNQQQVELLDRTVARSGVADREALVRLALREFLARHGADLPKDVA